MPCKQCRASGLQRHPSRDAANWLLSLFRLLVETRRQYGWLRMVFSGVRLVRAPIWWPREGGGTRAAGSTVAESLVVLSQVGTHQIRRRRRAARSLTSQERAEPCARESKARTGRFLREKLISDHGHFSSYEGHMERRTGKNRGFFQGCTGLWTAGCWLARRLHQLKASTTMDLGIPIFLIFVRCVALRNLKYC